MNNLTKMTTAQLWAELRAALKRTAEHIERVSQVWAELVRRGEDMSQVSTPFLALMPDVASGKLPAELVVRYGHDVRFLEVARELVPEDQRKLLDPSTRVDVVEAKAPGVFNVRKAEPIALRMHEIRQVFGDGRIRTAEEQQKLLRPRPAAPKPAPAPAPDTGVLDRAEFDVWPLLDVAQRVALAEIAEKRGMTAATLLVDLALRNKVIPPAKRRKRTVAQVENRAPTP